MDLSPYPEFPLRNATVTEVLPDARRRFVVVSGIRETTGEPWTLVLEHQDGYWISRRELSELLAPERAVLGALFDRTGHQDPLEMLRRMNELVRGEYYRLLQEKMKGDAQSRELVSEVSRLKAQLRHRTLPSRRGKVPSSRSTGRRRPS